MSWVYGSVKRPGARLVGSSGDGVASSSALERAADLATAVGFVSQHAIRPDPGTPTSDPLDRPLLHQRFDFRSLMTLSCRQHKSHWFTFPFRPQMQLGTKAALTLA